jgi:flavodoxin/NAD-dependent dihydropyrimidine dehydrogenase PreA subunit
MSQRILICYFSGTGNTQYVASRLKEALAAQNAAVELLRIDSTTPAPASDTFDLLGIAYPVHAFGVPHLVYHFLKDLPAAQNKPAFVFKTSGGGRTPLNDCSSWQLLSRLQGKGYQVFYERSFTMPSNWFFAHPADLSKQLCNAVADKTQNMAADLLLGVKRSIPCSRLLARIAYVMWLGENFGAKFFGKDLKANKKCTHCNRCVKECPAGNICERNGRIRFGWKCVWCMHCIYMCPAQAIMPRLEKFLILKNGYDLKKLLNDQSLKGEFLKPGATGFYAKHLKYLTDPTA